MKLVFVLLLVICLGCSVKRNVVEEGGKREEPEEMELYSKEHDVEDHPPPPGPPGEGPPHDGSKPGDHPPPPHGEGSKDGEHEGPDGSKDGPGGSEYGKDDGSEHHSKDGGDGPHGKEDEGSEGSQHKSEEDFQEGPPRGFDMGAVVIIAAAACCFCSIVVCCCFGYLWYRYYKDRKRQRVSPAGGETIEVQDVQKINQVPVLIPHNQHQHHHHEEVRRNAPQLYYSTTNMAGEVHMIGRPQEMQFQTPVDVKREEIYPPVMTDITPPNGPVEQRTKKDVDNKV